MNEYASHHSPWDTFVCFHIFKYKLTFHIFISKSFILQCLRRIEIRHWAVSVTRFLLYSEVEKSSFSSKGMKVFLNCKFYFWWPLHIMNSFCDIVNSKTQIEKHRWPIMCNPNEYCTKNVIFFVRKKTTKIWFLAGFLIWYQNWLNQSKIECFSRSLVLHTHFFSAV